MNKASILGAILIILGICAADSSSIIPSIILCALGGAVGAIQCANHC